MVINIELVIERNVSKMSGENSGELHNVLMKLNVPSSKIGDPNPLERLPVFNIPVFYNPKTGEIVYFGSSDEKWIDYYLREQIIKQGSLRVVVDLGEYKIKAGKPIEVRKGSYILKTINAKPSNEEAELVLKKSMEEYARKGLGIF